MNATGRPVKIFKMAAIVWSSGLRRNEIVSLLLNNCTPQTGHYTRMNATAWSQEYCWSKLHRRLVSASGHKHIRVIVTGRSQERQINATSWSHTNTGVNATGWLPKNRSDLFMMVSTRME